MNRILLLSLVVVATGCRTGPTLTPDAVLEADRQFARDVHTGGLEAWLSWFTDDAVRYGADGLPVQGKDAIRGVDGPFFDSGAFALRWEPEAAAVFDGGQTGLTRGRYALVSTASGDTLGTGRYSSMWRPTADGPRVFFDVGEVDP